MNRLSSATIRLLSSSQVITSVVSVVKELIENSLDASATNIDVKLENFGFDKIEVRDNGNGIKAADAPVMGVKHYTSKINSHEDLERLETYGFRGEALGSICCIAEVQITTKTAADQFSTLYILDSSGHVSSQKPSHLGQGTTVSVLKLFKNLPVRKQYYSTTKKCKEEIKKIQDLLMAYGILKPELRIVFTHNKAVVWQKSKVPDHKMAFMSVLGTATMSNMVPFQHQCSDPEIFIRGFLPKPVADTALTCLSSSERSFIFINNRPVHQKEILKMVRLYYSQCLNKDSSRCYPIFFMNIVLPASSLDVNLTPDKTQVMLLNKESVLLAIENVLRSVYPASVMQENDKADVKAESVVVNEKEYVDVNLDKKICVGNEDPEEHHLCSSVTYTVEDQNEVCLKQPIQSTDNIHDHDNRGISGIVGEKTDLFHSNLYKTSQEENQNDYGLTFTIDDNILMDTQANQDINLPCTEQTKQVEINETRPLNNSPDIIEEDWSKGVALKDSRGEKLEPVKIIGIKAECDVGVDDRFNSTDKSIRKTTNVVSEKSGFVTAYDLISNRVIKKPMSAVNIFMQEHRSTIVEENPKASIEDISSRAEELWEQLSQEEKLKYEDKAAKDLQRYSTQTAKASDQSIQKLPREVEKRHRLASGHSSAQKVKLKTPLSNQQILDKLFQSQAEKKKIIQPIKTVPIPFRLSTLKEILFKVPVQQNSKAKEFSLISKLNYPGAWITVSEEKIKLLNPYRVEEALLFKRLMEKHKISAEKLESPILLTDRLLGGPEYLDVLSRMQKNSPKLNGIINLSDLRLTANGFQIKMIPGTSVEHKHFEIEGMSSILPFYGVSDLKEILSCVLNKNAKELCECRPLKVLNYLEGEAVRLSRQLPLNLSEDDVHDTLHRMKQQLGIDITGCIHGRSFFHHLIDIPDSG
ncbi:PMS1 protein homolog 1 isoform 1-T2 [Discoglossus pictus]